MNKSYLYVIVVVLIIINGITLVFIYKNFTTSSSNFQTLQQSLSLAKDTVLIITPIITLIITVQGISKWKNEFKGKANFEASYKLLKAVYEMRDTFASARDPFIMSGEMLPDMNIRDYHIENERYVLSKRLVPLHQSYNHYNSLLPEVEALFGKEVKKICIEINPIMFKYHMTINEYLQLYGKTNNAAHFEKLSDLIYSKEDDELKKDIDIAIKKLEMELSKHIKMN